MFFFEQIYSNAHTFIFDVLYRYLLYSTLLEPERCSQICEPSLPLWKYLEAVLNEYEYRYYGQQIY